MMVREEALHAAPEIGRVTTERPLELDPHTSRVVQERKKTP